MRRSPYPVTVRALAKALGLDATAQARLLAAVQLRSGVPEAPGPTASPPIPLSSFVGREREVAEIGRLLATTRLLTLTGTGGIGKTRLALQVAMELVGSYPDGVWLVELAPVVDPGLVPQAVAAVIGVREQPGRPLLQTLADALRDRHLLLVLDNCEHLVGACAELVDALLRACPELWVLATSREPLRVSAETTWRVPPLSVPAPLDGRAIDETARSEAGRLFVERARAVRPEFALTAQTAGAVADVCRRLDGVPLALELAAAWVGVLAVEDIAVRLTIDSACWCVAAARHHHANRRCRRP